MKNLYTTTLLVVFFFMFQNVSLAQNEHGYQRISSPQVVELSFYKASDKPITAKTIDYFLQIENKSSSGKPFYIEGEVISCDENAVQSPNITFEILSADGNPLTSVKAAGNQTVNFVVRTTKPITDKVFWGCVEIRTKSESSSSNSLASLLIKQLNPGAGNFK